MDVALIVVTLLAAAFSMTFTVCLSVLPLTSRQRSVLRWTAILLMVLATISGYWLWRDLAPHFEPPSVHKFTG